MRYEKTPAATALSFSRNDSALGDGAGETHETVSPGRHFSGILLHERRWFMSKAEKRIEKKNKKKSEEVPVVGIETEAPTGPEPFGIKEKVKQGFLSIDEALQSLEGKEQPGTKIVAWLRRRQHA